MRVEISNKHRTGRPRRAGGREAHVDVYSQDFLTRTNLTSSLRHRLGARSEEIMKAQFDIDCVSDSCSLGAASCSVLVLAACGGGIRMGQRSRADRSLPTPRE